MTGQQNYSLHIRTTKKGLKIFYVQFRLPTGKWSNAKSTGQTDIVKAEKWVQKYLSKGQPVFKKNITLFEFSGNDFFNYGGQWEFNKRIAAKKKPSPRWCSERTNLLKTHIIPTLGNYRLILITDEVITEFRNSLAIKGFSGSYINKILTTLREILKAAYKKHLIQAIPEFELAAINENRRGRLTRHEIRKLFAFDWTDERSYITALIAATTGARLSEIQALKINDIQPDGSFTICKAWERFTKKVKERTKSGIERHVKLHPEHLARVLKYLANHPYKNTNGFLIYSDVKPLPASDTIIMRPFHAALEKIGITENERKRRGICFHSFRYYCNSSLIDAGVPGPKVREQLGHCDESLTQRYYRSENSDDVLQAIIEAVPLPETLTPDDTPPDVTH